MEVQFVTVLESLYVDTHDVPVILHSDEQCASSGVQEGSDGLEDGLLHPLIYLPGLKIGHQCGFEFQSSGFSLVYEILGLLCPIDSDTHQRGVVRKESVHSDGHYP